MSESKSNKRKHSTETKHKKSKKIKVNKSPSEKIKNHDVNAVENDHVEDVVDFESEKEKRRTYVAEIQKKRDGLTSDDRSKMCPYLDTINRNVLDFDFEKLCCISLTHLNVYACLVCGKYYQGRGTNTHAHTHSVDNDHHVFLNLETHRFYCLPDNYEIIDSSLEDIIYLLNPTFTKKQIALMGTEAKLVRANNGNTYYPGIVGLNNIKANDYCNVMLQVLSHIYPIRNYFLQESNYSSIKFAPGNQMHILVQRFGELIRKLWNPRNFKTHVSPHEFLQAVVLCSKKRFQFTTQSNAVDFLSWLMNALHTALKGTGKGETILSKAFRGKMQVYTHKVIPVDLSREDKRKYALSDEYQTKQEEIKYFYLTCDLPPPPLFKDEMQSTVIPQVPLTTLLNKFNGLTEKEYKTHKESFMKRFKIQKLPPYLVLYFKRFVSNYFRNEKYPTIVTFPITSFDFSDLLLPEFRKLHKYTIYDLVANVTHEGEMEPGTGIYKVHINHQETGKWYCMQDLHVNEIISEMIPLGETVLQVWKVNKTHVNSMYSDE